MDGTLLDYSVLGALLREARQASGFSQADTAKWLGITYQNVSSWERGASKIDIDSLLILCNRYGIDFKNLVNRATRENPATTSDDGITPEILAIAKKFSRLSTEDLELLSAQTDVMLRRRSK